MEGPEGSIKLAGQAGHFDLTDYGYRQEHVRGLDRAGRLAVAAAIAVAVHKAVVAAIVVAAPVA